MGASFADNWPRWPDGVQGKHVLEIQVGCSVDKLFETVFAGDSDFTVRVHAYLQNSLPYLYVTGLLSEITCHVITLGWYGIYSPSCQWSESVRAVGCISASQSLSHQNAAMLCNWFQHWVHLSHTGLICYTSGPGDPST